MRTKRPRSKVVFLMLLGAVSGCIEVTGLSDLEYAHCLSDSDCAMPNARRCVQGRCVSGSSAEMRSGTGGTVVPVATAPAFTGMGGGTNTGRTTVSLELPADNARASHGTGGNASVGVLTESNQTRFGTGGTRCSDGCSWGGAPASVATDTSVRSVPEWEVSMTSGGASGFRSFTQAGSSHVANGGYSGLERQNPSLGGVTVGGDGSCVAGDLSVAGTSVTAGGAAGVAGRAPTGGANPGAAGATSNAGRRGQEPPRIPECKWDETGQFPVSLQYAHGVGASLTWWPRTFQLYASSWDNWTVAEKWGWDDGKPAMPKNPTRWVCFNGVSGARRIAAANLNDDNPEVYLTTETGELYQRNFSLSQNGWQPWTACGLPQPDSHVVDVAISPRGTREHVYVVDRGEVFVRFRENLQVDAPYSQWQNLGSVGGQVVAVAVLRDGRQLVLSVDEDGTPLASQQRSEDTPGLFDGWREFVDGLPLPPIVDIEGGVEPGGNLMIFAVDAGGGLWTREEVSGARLGEWHEWDGPSPPTQLRVLASVRMQLDSFGATALVGISSEGRVLMTIGRPDGWGDWTMLDL